MKTYRAPEPIEEILGRSIFLAGTIDNGNSADWQEEVISLFSGKQYTILNPRRKEWDVAWNQSADNPYFNEQVNWELSALEKADIIIINFLAGSQSPTTMLELGLHAHSGKLRVCCPRAFWRSGNIHIVCRRYNIPLYTDMNDLIADVANDEHGKLSVT